MNSPIRHTMLVANAGSGKTYALTTRMVKLLVIGVHPRKIAALTFTRKAAGEFLDAVFLRLAGAALDSKELEHLNGDLNSEKEEGAVPPLDAERCRELLALLVEESGLLTVGTIDSLFARIARSFPLESGLPGEFAMIGESELERARTEALASVFRNSAQASEFLDLVRRIARRHGERQVFRTLLQSVKDFHEQYLQDITLPWGDRDLIWKGIRCDILEAGEVKPAADAFWAEIERTHPDLSDAASSKIQELVTQAIEHRRGSAWSKSLKGFIAEKLSGELKRNDDGIPFFGLINGSPKNRILLRPKLDALRAELRNALLKPLYEDLLARSAALKEFMESFEGSYHTLTRGRGMMTFSDVTALLAEQVATTGWTTGAGYRLDTKLDHWLLDEFQDTSRLQWKVLGSFIDEVIQDEGGERSFFYVGDTKQAIYSWRGGDPELFFEIHKKYTRDTQDRIFRRKLDVSFRSAKEIIGVINKVFGSIASHATTLGIPEKTVAAWDQGWSDHRGAERNKELKGYVRWEAVGSDEEGCNEGDARHESSSERENGDEEDSTPIHRRVAKILHEVRPWDRGLTCAVLTRKNSDASSIAGYLQALGVPVSLEGKSNPCNDNPLGLALMAAFRTASYPEDSISLALLKGSPLSGLLSEGVETFRAGALESIASKGCEETVRLWIEGLDLNPFLSGRAAAFLAAAGDYDEGGRGAISEFLAYLEGHSVQEAEASGVVRVMTLHQSKGLTFDMSVVMGLDGRGSNNTDTLHLGGGEPPTWGCLLPGKELAAPDPVMSEAVSENKAEEEYGKLCAAYVAMSRSKQALYVLTKKLKEETTSKNFARLLMLTLSPVSDTVAFGEETWHEGHPVLSNAGGDTLSKSLPLMPCTSGTPHPISPSSQAHRNDSEVLSASAFSADAADLGTEVHKVLSLISWDPSVVDLSGCSQEARRLLEAFLASEEARRIFTRPEGDQAGKGENGEWVCWNEKPFDLIVNGKWVSGCFDRVHVLREGGHAISAEILDYKTNRSTPEAIAQCYQGQMNLYVEAASLLLGIPTDQISARTVPVRVS